MTHAHGTLRTASWTLVFTLCALGCTSGPERSNPFLQTEGDSGSPPPPPPPPPRDSGPAPGRCASDNDCDDRIDCTFDECVVGGVCEHTAMNNRCPSGQRCTTDRGCTTGRMCATDAECNDNIPCTRDLCAAGGACTNVRNDSMCATGMRCSVVLGCVTPPRCGADVDCADGRFCNGDEVCSNGTCQAASGRNCADNDACTGDVCNESMQRCDHPALNPCGGGQVMAGTYTLSSPIMYQCGAGQVGVASIVLTTSAGGIQVTGFGATTLTGPASTNGMFMVTGSEPRGGCTWRYTLLGAFTMPNRYEGSWNISFDFCSSLNMCFSRSGATNGTLR